MGKIAGGLQQVMIYKGYNAHSPTNDDGSDYAYCGIVFIPLYTGIFYEGPSTFL